MSWQPIETAPRDGTPLLLYCPGMNSWNRKQGMPDIVVGIWVDNSCSWERGSWFSDVGDVGQGYESTGAYFEHEHLSPKLWHLLPELPAKHRKKSA
jgi:hypothetical protein